MSIILNMLALTVSSDSSHKTSLHSDWGIYVTYQKGKIPLNTTFLSPWLLNYPMKRNIYSSNQTYGSYNRYSMGLITQRQFRNSNIYSMTLMGFTRSNSVTYTDFIVYDGTDLIPYTQQQNLTSDEYSAGVGLGYGFVPDNDRKWLLIPAVNFSILTYLVHYNEINTRNLVTLEQYDDYRLNGMITGNVSLQFRIKYKINATWNIMADWQQIAGVSKIFDSVDELSSNSYHPYFQMNLLSTPSIAVGVHF